MPRQVGVSSHYIHIFYDENDRGVECVLTSQLLAMRRALQPSFPQHDCYDLCCFRVSPVFYTKRLYRLDGEGGSQTRMADNDRDL